MMDNADVVQSIFRALGIPGWEMVGMEPADAPASALPARSASMESADRDAIIPASGRSVRGRAKPRGRSRRRSRPMDEPRSDAGFVDIASVCAELLRDVRGTPAADAGEGALECPAAEEEMALLAAASAGTPELGDPSDAGADGKAPALVRDGAV